MEHHLNTQYHVTQPTLRRPPRRHRADLALTCAVALLGLLISAAVLRSWSLHGPLTPFSYMAAGTLYVLAPAGLSWRFLNEQFKTH